MYVYINESREELFKEKENRKDRCKKGESVAHVEG